MVDGLTEGTKTCSCTAHNEDMKFTVAHITLIFARLVIAFLLINWFLSKMRVFKQPKDFLEHVTNNYYMPPMFIMDRLPKFMEHYAHDSRGWVSFEIAGTHFFIYAIALVHSFTPFKWPTKRDIETATTGIPTATIRGFYAESNAWLYAFVILPAVIGINIITVYFKTMVPRKTLKIKYTHKRDNTIERIIKFLVSLIFGAFAALLTTIVLLHVHAFRNFKRDFVGFVMVVTGIIFAYVFHASKDVQLWSEFLRDRFEKWTIAKEEKEKKQKQKQRESTLLNLQGEDGSVTAPLNSGNDDSSTTPMDDNEKTDEPATPLPTTENAASVPPPMKKIDYDETEFSIWAHLFKYLIPTWLFDAAWMISWFFLSYIAGTVITRLIWSSLLLIIFNPDQVQLYLYIISLLTTVYKFFGELNEPYAKVKAFLANNRYTMTLRTANNLNNFILPLTQQQLRLKKEIQEDCFYFQKMQFSQFLELCRLVNVRYFLRAVVARMFFTLFVLGMFFLGTFIFNSGGGNEQFNVTLKILVSSLLPLIPQLVSTLSNRQNEMENAVLTARLKNSTVLLEWKYAPANLPSGVFPKFFVINAKPPKDQDPDKIIAIDYDDNKKIVLKKDLDKKNQ